MIGFAPKADAKARPRASGASGALISGGSRDRHERKAVHANAGVVFDLPREAQVDTWMGTSNGHWEGETLVVDVTGLNGQSWFDRSGNFMSENVHIVERYTLADADHINYEATIDDSTIFTRPWKISLPLYRRKEKNAQLGEFKCVEFAEELIYGHLRKQTK